MLNWLSGDWLINGLSGYVRNLVLIVFLVSFFEMLAPENAMKRFVQVVAGFVVIVAVLQPLLAFVNRGQSGLEQASWSSLSQEYSSRPRGRGGSETAVDLEASNSQRALRLLEGRVAETVNSEVQRLRPGAMSKVDVGLSQRGQLESVTVTLSRQGMAVSGDNLTGGVRVAVEPVRPITRGVNAGLSGKSASGGGSVDSDAKLEKAIADHLGMAPGQVHVVIRPLATR